MLGSYSQNTKMNFKNVYMFFIQFQLLKYNKNNDDNLLYLYFICRNMIFNKYNILKLFTVKNSPYYLRYLHT